MNQITVGGHLGADPEVRFTSSGQKVTTLRVASRARRNKEEETIWWRVTVWGEQFDRVIPYFKKGSPIMVVGDLSKPEIFTDRDGKPQVSMNITAYHLAFSPFGRADGSPSNEPRKEEAFAGATQQQSQFGQGQNHQQGQQHQNQGFGGASFNDDEIPF